MILYKPASGFCSRAIRDVIYLTTDDVRYWAKLGMSIHLSYRTTLTPPKWCKVSLWYVKSKKEECSGSRTRFIQFSTSYVHPNSPKRSSQFGWLLQLESAKRRQIVRKFVLRGNWKSWVNRRFFIIWILKKENKYDFMQHVENALNIIIQYTRQIFKIVCTFH